MTEQILSNPHFKPLEEKLIGRFGHTKGQQLLERIHSELVRLLSAHSDDAPDLRSESHGYILPSIAIYKTLKTQLEQSEALSLFKDIYFTAAYQAAASIGKKAEDAAYREQFLQMMVANKEGIRAGFEYRTVENTVSAVEFHVLRCPYVAYCSLYDCQELTPVFCECDDVFYGNIHPKIRWERTKTLGRGHDLCNFRFRLSEDKSESKW
ncbi:MAG: L-2-amino-thiazoline-4-carboxylic acid hydrolase [Clostridia bacterium]|nr:L-2-amino-thiazoline-4-carboxylic acid hydrolase [Clostridia bacterium]